MQKTYLVKLGFQRLKPGTKVIRAAHIVWKMDGNPIYPNPIPSLAQVATATSELKSAVSALDGSKISTALKNKKEAALNEKITELGGYIQSASGGNKEKILSSGFDVRGTRTKVGLLGPVETLTLKLGLLRGSINLKWKGIKNTKIYITEMATDINAQNWKTAAQTSKAKVTITGLTSGQSVYFRVTYISSSGMGPWSEIYSIDVY